MNCWIDDSTATGAYASKRWFFVTTSGGTRGFVHSSRVGSQISTPKCTTHRGIAASRWAAMQQGEVAPDPAELNGNSTDRWSGYCWLFAYDAFKLTGGKAREGQPSALSAYNSYKASGLVSTNFNPKAISIGSIVFWNFSPHGHAAIYTGQGYVQSTQGNGSKRQPNFRISIAQLNQKYGRKAAGWVSPTNAGR